MRGLDPRGPEYNLRKIDGVYRFPMAHEGRHKWISTGKTDRHEARDLIIESGADRLYHLELTRAISARAISVITAGRDLNCRRMADQWVSEANTLSKSSIKVYLFSLDLFLQRYGLEGRQISEVTKEMVHEFINEAPITFPVLSTRHKAVKAFLQHMNDAGLLYGNAAKLVRIETENMTLEQLSASHAIPWMQEDYARFMQAPVARHWKILVALSWWTALRQSDCCGLEWAAFTLKPGHLVIQQRKIRRMLYIPLKDPLVGSPDLLAILAEIQAMPDKDPEFCFPELRHMSINKQPELSSKYARLFKQAKIRPGLTFHGLRHGFKVRLQAAGKTLQEIQYLMGHRNVVSTLGYGHEFPEEHEPVRSSAAARPVPAAVPVPAGPKTRISADSAPDEEQLTA